MSEDIKERRKKKKKKVGDLDEGCLIRSEFSFKTDIYPFEFVLL